MQVFDNVDLGLSPRKKASLEWYDAKHNVSYIIHYTVSVKLKRPDECQNELKV